VKVKERGKGGGPGERKRNLKKTKSSREGGNKGDIGKFPGCLVAIGGGGGLQGSKVW